MEKINVVMAGMPGSMATTTVLQLLRDSRFNVMDTALTGSEISESSIYIDGLRFFLFKPNKHEYYLNELKNTYHQEFIIIDYSHPLAVNRNAELYTKLNIPFVMGTTGGNRDDLISVIERSNTCAVIAQNMAKQIVGFQAMFEYASSNFPDLFKGYTLEITESHQKSKVDTSGTAKAMVIYFNKLGIHFLGEQIKKIRNRFLQLLKGIPLKYLKGHGWHTYTLKSEDGSVFFQFIHNVNGREIYALGTIDAILFLSGKMELGTMGKVYSMIDVLKG